MYIVRGENVKKRKVLLGSIILIGTVLLSGCIGDNSEPPSYPSYPKNLEIDVSLDYEPPVFYFGDVVQENGSVNKTKKIDWVLTINNQGSRTEDITFEISYFTPELLVWSTTVTYNDGYIIAYPEYDYDDAKFERHDIRAPSNKSTDFIVSIKFNKTVPWSYCPDTSYMGRFIVRSRVYARHDTRSSIYYEKEIIPFVVRT